MKKLCAALTCLVVCSGLAQAQATLPIAETAGMVAGMRLEWDGTLSVLPLPETDEIQPLPLTSDYSLTCSACLNTSTNRYETTWAFKCNTTPWVSYLDSTDHLFGTQRSTYNPPSPMSNGGGNYPGQGSGETNTFSFAIYDSNFNTLSTCVAIANSNCP